MYWSNDNFGFYFGRDIRRCHGYALEIAWGKRRGLIPQGEYRHRHRLEVHFRSPVNLWWS